MPRKKDDPDRIIDDEDFLFDAPKRSLQDLPKSLNIAIEPAHKSDEPTTVAIADSLTTYYLGDGKLPGWMKEASVKTTRK